MLKKINIILIGIAISFSLKLNMGFCLILPLTMFYILKDIKNMYYIYIPQIIVTLLFMREYLIVLLITLIVISLCYFLITSVISRKLNKLTSLSIIILLVMINTLLDIYLQIDNVYNLVLTNLLCGLIYLYLERYLYKIILEEDVLSDNSKLSLSYLEMMIALITIVSISKVSIFNVNLGFVSATYFAMYFGKSYKNIYSLIYGIFSMLVLYLAFNISEALFLPFISSIYIISSMLVIVLFNITLIMLLFTNSGYDTNSILSLMMISIIFELLNPFILESKKDNSEMFEYIYNQVQKSTNDEILNFSLFIDKFTSGFKNPKEFNNRLSEGIKTINQKNCSSCDKRKECFGKYKLGLYNIFKSILLQEPNFKNNYPEFVSYCERLNSIYHTSKCLEPSIRKSIDDESKSQNNIMIAQLNGVSNAIKKYVIDLSSKEEISYYQMIQIKNKLENYGYEITYFEVIKLFRNDFNLKIGINKVKYHNVKNTIYLIATNILNQEVSIILDSEIANKTYINIVPKIKIDITYGFGALSCDGEEICGDNYLIKEINNGHFISAISDGMGKGYKAFYESDMTLKLVEDIIKLNLTSGTALEILNSFYAVQEYLEQYATLDFLEINRYTKVANFYKMGATSTYIFRQNGKLEKIINKSLPFGLDEDITSTSYELKSGDLILMSSDGIFENIIDEASLNSYIKSIKNLPPQRIVYELLNYTINSKIKTKDDMSIIALKIQDAA